MPQSREQFVSELILTICFQGSGLIKDGMCDPSKEKTPTVEGLRAARHAGFAAAISLCSAKERKRSLKSYVAQDARRGSQVMKLGEALKGCGGSIDEKLAEETERFGEVFPVLENSVCASKPDVSTKFQISAFLRLIFGGVVVDFPFTLFT
ncbi:hypothetical protein HZ994_15335 [Akkermansiaceae bacterium]|nr:hypothetical protein HZ994_15335 [Akkermansiaceae bacterium]